MDRVYLQEAFRSMELLEEEDFRLDDVGVKDILDFKDHDELNDIVDVIDPEADTQEEVKDSYIGSVILECEVCHSPIFKDVEDVEIDEESGLANIEDECPICHSQDGFKIIGQVCPFQEDPEIKVEVEDKLEDDEEEDEDEEDEDDFEESLQEELDPELADRLDKIEGKISEIAKHVCPECDDDEDEFDEYDESEFSDDEDEDDDIQDESLNEAVVFDDVDRYESNVYDTSAVPTNDAIRKSIRGAGQIANDNKMHAQAIGDKNYEKNISRKTKPQSDKAYSQVNELVKNGKLSELVSQNPAVKKTFTEFIKWKAADQIKSPEEVNKLLSVLKSPDKIDKYKQAFQIYLFNRLNHNYMGESLNEMREKHVIEVYKYKLNDNLDTIEDESKPIKVFNGKSIQATEYAQYLSSKDYAHEYVVTDNVKMGGSGNVQHGLGIYYKGQNISGKTHTEIIKLLGKPNEEIPENSKNQLDSEDTFFMKDSQKRRADKYLKKSEMHEGFEKVDLEMEDKIIHVSEEEKPSVEGEEMITPVSDELEAELMTPEEEEEEVMPEEEAPVEEVPEEGAPEEEGEMDDIDFEDEEIPEDEIPEDEDEEGYDGQESLKSTNKSQISEECDACEKCKKEKEDKDNMIDYDVDDFEEKEFNKLGESYLKRVYDNVSGFKTSSVSSENNKLVVEGIITFNSGKEKSTKFIFEAKDATKSGKVRFIGENAQISRGKKSFTLSGNISKGKFIAESLNYSYMVDSNRVYGTVKVRD